MWMRGSKRKVSILILKVMVNSDNVSVLDMVNLPLLVNNSDEAESFCCTKSVFRLFSEQNPGAKSCSPYSKVDCSVNW